MLLQVRDLLAAYGRLRSFNLVVDHGTGASKGFAFCEYADPLDSDRAITNITGTQVSGLSRKFWGLANTPNGQFLHHHQSHWHSGDSKVNGLLSSSSSFCLYLRILETWYAAGRALCRGAA